MRSRMLAWRVAVMCAAALGWNPWRGLATARAAEPESFDIVVYGGTAGGVMAAVQAAKLGKRVVLIEPGRHLGGLTSSGLGATDIGNKAAIGGLARSFYKQLGRHYAQDEAWTFEPHVAEGILDSLVSAPNITVVRHERLDLESRRATSGDQEKSGDIKKAGAAPESAGVKKSGARILFIRMESGRRFAGRMFIDATYEGDLMAKAGVSYSVGREANAEFKETLNGVQPGATSHQFKTPVDPYLDPRNPSSGLLPEIEAGLPGDRGAGDRRVQAYCFRMCLTDAPANQLPFPRPRAYDPRRYELLLRYLKTGVFDVLGNNQRMPNHKTDTNNNGGFSTDHIGANYDYPDGGYAVRERIIRDHIEYQQGLMYFLANDPRVPEKAQREIRRWGLAKDEFTDNGGWPWQLYVREARRMKSDYVMTQHNCQGREAANDSIGLAAYGMDSHNVQRYVTRGHIQNEGDVQVHGFEPYPISYRAIVPKAAECANLLVPVCVSSTHIAYGSIRMEPVFMVLGQSAATAACQAIDEGRDVRQIDIAGLQERLRSDGQILAWQPKKKAEH